MSKGTTAATSLRRHRRGHAFFSFAFEESLSRHRGELLLPAMKRATHRFFKDAVEKKQKKSVEKKREEKRE